jgi:hypothetical protein
MRVSVSLRLWYCPNVFSYDHPHHPTTINTTITNYKPWSVAIRHILISHAEKLLDGTKQEPPEPEPF